MEVRRVLDVIKFKCRYCDKAVDGGKESVPKGMAPEEMPEEVRGFRGAVGE